jgi:hypothetical protein
MRLPAKEQADQMVHDYRMILINEDTDYGNEILCTSIAIKCALKGVDKILDYIQESMQGWCDWDEIKYWEEVKQEIKN